MSKIEEKKKSFQFKKYKGKWFEQGSTPLWFSKGCKNTTANYSKRTDGTIDVVNTCDKPKGFSIAKGRAFPTKENRKLKVGFFPSSFPLFRSDYNIEYIEERNNRYKNAIVSSKDSTWILTRKKNISDKEYKRLKSVARKKGLNTKGLKRTTQKGG